jgi:carboxyl-terminal processing protease
MTSRIRLSPALVGLAALVLAACQSALPYVRSGEPAPAPVVVADGSPERRALNEQVYGAATDWVGQLFYRPDFNGVDWPVVAAQRREAAVAQPDEFAFYDSLNEVLEVLDDRHTNAMAPHRRQRNEAIERGDHHASYGMALRWTPDGWFVNSVRGDGSAVEAGVQIGWRLETLNGRPLEGAAPPADGRVDEAVFTDEHGARQVRSLTGENLPAEPRRSVERLDGGGMYLAFEDFDGATADWVLEQLATAAAENPSGVIVDLRENDGGQISAMLRIMGGLIERKQTAAVRTGRLIDLRYEAEPAEAPWLGPLIVLVDCGSASASEILTAALQESGRAVVMGERTTGIVVLSNTLNLPDGGRLSVGVHELRTPSRATLEGHGVTPDVEIVPALAQRRAGEDVILAAAVARLAANP